MPSLTASRRCVFCLSLSTLRLRLDSPLSSCCRPLTPWSDLGGGYIPHVSGCGPPPPTDPRPLTGLPAVPGGYFQTGNSVTGDGVCRQQGVIRPGTAGSRGRSRDWTAWLPRWGGGGVGQWKSDESLGRVSRISAVRILKTHVFSSF